MYRITKPDTGQFTVDLPSSKSVTHRILILGALNSGRTIISNALLAEDTEITIQALINMGAGIDHSQQSIEISRPVGVVRDDQVFLGNSGSSARFLIPLGALLDKPMRFYGHDRLHQRPFSQLFAAMKNLGIRIGAQNDSLPAVIQPGIPAGGSIVIEQLPSSQIISALMMSALWMTGDLTMVLPDDTPSMPYIKMTLDLMKRLGLKTDYQDNRITVKSGKPDLDWNYKVEKDFSAASYWVVLSMLHNSKLVLPGVTLPSLQGDERIFSIATELGSEIMLYPDRLELIGRIRRGLKTDCNDIPDLVPSLSILAMFAPEKSELRNIKHLEYKESNRIQAIRSGIKALGGSSHYQDGNLTIVPADKYRAAEIETFDDHRMAMCFAIAGTRIPGTMIKDPGCVQKSYPNFWRDFTFWDKVTHEG